MFHPEILTGSPEWRRQTTMGGENDLPGVCSNFMRQYRENGTRYDQSY